MQAQQRAAPEAADMIPTARRWAPSLNQVTDSAAVGLIPDGAGAPGEEEAPSYVVVDDIAEVTAVLEISEWPLLDRDGRLYFTSEGQERAVPLEKFQTVVDRARTSTDQFAPRRPLRIGDVFAVYGPVTEDLRNVTQVLDISAAARRAAKAALYGAVVSTVPDEYAVRNTTFPTTSPKRHYGRPRSRSQAQGDSGQQTTGASGSSTRRTSRPRIRRPISGRWQS